MANVVDFQPGGYRYVKAVFQYSAGVAAQPGFVIERVSLDSVSVGSVPNWFWGGPDLRTSPSLGWSLTLGVTTANRAARAFCRRRSSGPRPPGPPPADRLTAAPPLSGRR